MSNVVSISSFNPQSYSICLRQLYRKLDRTSFKSSVSLEVRKDFFIKTRGEFLLISRKKKNIAIEASAQYLGVHLEQLANVEAGMEPISGPTFLTLCVYYETLNDAFILTDKIENALNPRLRAIREKNIKNPKRLSLLDPIRPHEYGTLEVNKGDSVV